MTPAAFTFGYNATNLLLNVSTSNNLLAGDYVIQFTATANIDSLTATSDKITVTIVSNSSYTNLGGPVFASDPET